MKPFAWTLLAGLAVFCSPVLAVTDSQYSEFARQLEYVGPAVQQPGYHVWGSSPIIGPEGRTHLFCARWPITARFDPGWRSHSEIAHYVSDSPEGPFTFCEVALTGTGQDTWDKYAPCNPAIHQVGDKYYLLYTANNNPSQPPHPKNQRIGMAVADSLDGPWRRVGADGMILAPSTDPEYWTYNAGNGVVNPALLQHPDGRFFLYFKSANAKMGLAIAENIEGPYVQLKEPVTYNNSSIEDGYAFMMDGRICLLTTDNHGILIRGGGLLWQSDDGLKFDAPMVGFDVFPKYLEGGIPAGAKNYYGGVTKFERPQVLMIDERPAYLYVPSGTNIYGGDGTISYIMKVRCGAENLAADLNDDCKVDIADLAIMMENWLTCTLPNRLECTDMSLTN